MIAPTRRQKLLVAMGVASAVILVPLITRSLSGPVEQQFRGPTEPQRILSPCVGTAVDTTADLGELVASKPTGTTFCLRAGTYELTSTVMTKPGDAFIGTGADQTFIRPSGVAAPTEGFQSAYGNDGTVPVTFAQVDIGGFTADPSSTTCNNNCGTAIWNHGVPGQGGVILRDVACHDNGTSCVGHGFGDAVVKRIDCYANGFHHDTLLTDFRSAACIKLTEGSLVVRDSFIHANAWEGLWCDYCGNTHSLIEDNVIVRNGRSGVYWEMSGQFVPGDNIVVQNNVIQNNGVNCDPTPGAYADPTSDGSQLAAGIVIEDGSNITIRGNTFGGNSACEELGFRAVNAYDGPRDGVVQNVLVANNVLNGDRLGGPVQGDLCARPGVTCTGEK
jgi:hypothetical protein